MVSWVGDRIQETSTSTGTGAFTLAGAVAGFNPFSVDFANGNTCHYLIEAVDGSGVPTGDWEIGIGTYNGTDTITRTTVQRSSNSDSVVNFAAGAKRVHCIAPAESIRRQFAVVTLTATLTGQNYTTATAVPWDNMVVDDDGYYSGGANTRLTVRAYSGRVRLSCQVGLANLTATDWVSVEIRRGGSASYSLSGAVKCEAGRTDPVVGCQTGWIAAGLTDYYEVFVQVESDTSVDLNHLQSWFQIETMG